MSGTSIAAEVANALSEVASDVGDGSFTVTLVRKSGPANPWDNGAVVTETFDLPAMVSNFPRSQIDGTLIEQNDRRVMMAATGERPSVSDSLRINGVEYSIVNVREMSPSGVPLYFEVQARV